MPKNPYGGNMQKTLGGGSVEERGRNGQVAST